VDKSNISSRKEEYHSGEPSSFELKFFAGSPPREFSNFNGKKLNHPVKKGVRKPEGDLPPPPPKKKHKNKTNRQAGLCQPFEVSNV